VQYSIPAQYVLVVNCAVSSMTSRSLLTSYWIWSPGIWTSTVQGNYGSGSVNHYCLCVQHCLCGLHTHTWTWNTWKELDNILTNDRSFFRSICVF